MSIAKGKANWARVIGVAQVDSFNPEGVWSLDLVVTDEERERLEAEGLKGKGKEPNTFTFKLKAFRNDGSPNKAPRVVDGDKKPWDEDTMIGNGSTVNVSYLSYDHKMSSMYGKGKLLKAIQVIDLVPYAGGTAGAGAGVDEFESAGTDSVADDDEF